jgi:acetyl esterase/lipase
VIGAQHRAHTTKLPRRSRWIAGISGWVLVASLFGLPANLGAALTFGLSSHTRPVAAEAGGRYFDHHFGTVAVRRGVVYRRAVRADGRAVALQLDVYTPAGDTARNRAAIVWLHPGGFTDGDRTDMAAFARDDAERGFVAVAVDYRVRPGVQWFDLVGREAAARDAYDDAVAAIEFLTSHANEYGIDPSLVFAGGYSAGAITAFDLAYPPDGARRVALAGVVPISGYGNGMPAPGAPPVLAFQGTTDPLVPYALARRTCTEARRAGDDCTLVTLSGAGHDIGTTMFAAISDSAAAFLAAIVAQPRVRT